MPAAPATLLIAQGEEYTYAFTYETGAPPSTVQVDGWHAEVRFADVNGGVLVISDAQTALGWVELKHGPGQSPNVIIHIYEVGTELFTSSGEYSIALIDNSGLTMPILRGQYKVQAEVPVP